MNSNASSPATIDPKTGAAAILDLASDVLELTCYVASRVESKLEDVMLPDYPMSAPDLPPECKAAPLFATLHDKLDHIRAELRRIDHNLDRVDL